MAAMNTPERWVGVREVAEHLNMSDSWVNKAVQWGTIPVHRVGRNLRFRLSEVDAWVERQASLRGAA